MRGQRCEGSRRTAVLADLFAQAASINVGISGHKATADYVTLGGSSACGLGHHGVMMTAEYDLGETYTDIMANASCLRRLRTGWRRLLGCDRRCGRHIGQHRLFFTFRAGWLVQAQRFVSYWHKQTPCRAASSWLWVGVFGMCISALHEGWVLNSTT